MNTENRRELPILFNTEMMLAVVSGRKTQTRRPLRKQPKAQGTWAHKNGSLWVFTPDSAQKHSLEAKCPFGTVGDTLWVRETWSHPDHPFAPYREGDPVFYRVDYADDPFGFDGPDGCRKWIPSIHMPRIASRINLRVTGIGIERLQNISREDALAEGMSDTTDPVSAFIHVWQGAYGQGDLISSNPNEWYSNPWVWVVTFEKETA